MPRPGRGLRRRAVDPDDSEDRVPPLVGQTHVNYSFLDVINVNSLACNQEFTYSFERLVLGCIEAKRRYSRERAL